MLQETLSMEIAPIGSTHYDACRPLRCLQVQSESIFLIGGRNEKRNKKTRPATMSTATVARAPTRSVRRSWLTAVTTC